MTPKDYQKLITEVREVSEEQRIRNIPLRGESGNHLVSTMTYREWLIGTIAGSELARPINLISGDHTAEMIIGLADDILVRLEAEKRR